MKNVRRTLFLMVLLIGSISFANVNTNSDQLISKKISDQLYKKLMYPNLKKHDLGDVKIHFRIGEDNEIELLDIEVDKPALRKFVVSKLNTRKLDVEGLKKGDTYTFEVTFIE